MTGIAFRFAMRRYWKTAAILAGVIALFCWMALAVSSSFFKDLGDVPFITDPPRAMSAFLGGAGSFLSAEGWLATTFTHPIILSMSAVGALMVASGTGAQELEVGTLDAVLSRPISRSQHLRGRLAAGLLLSGVVQLGMLVGVLLAYTTLVDVRVLELSRVILACLGAVAIYSFFACAGMWVFAGHSQRGRAMAWAIGIVTGSYLLNFVALAFEATEFLAPLTPFRYFRPGALLSGEEVALTFTVLPAAAMACALGALWTFNRRDLSR